MAQQHQRNSGGGNGPRWVTHDEWLSDVRRQDERAEAQGKALADLGAKMDSGFESLRRTISMDHHRRDEQSIQDRRNREVRWVPILAFLVGAGALVVSIAAGVAAVINSKIDTTSAHQEDVNAWRDRVAELRQEKIGAVEAENIALGARLQREMRDLDTGLRSEFMGRVALLATGVADNAAALERLSADAASLRATVESLASNRFTGADGQKMRADLIEIILEIERGLRTVLKTESSLDPPGLDNLSLLK